MPFMEADIQEKIRGKKESSIEFKNVWNAKDNERKIISEIIQTRKNRNLTQRELAQLSQNTQQEISRMERGIHSPSLTTVCRVINSMGYELVVKEIEKD